MTHKQSTARLSSSPDSPSPPPRRQHRAGGKSVNWRLKVSVHLPAYRPKSSFARRTACMFGLEKPIGETLYDNFRFEVRPGQIVAVVGPSGSGKSVLIGEVARQAPSAVRLQTETLAASPICPLELPGALHRQDKRKARPQSAMLNRWLKTLSICGLAEAPLLSRPARLLSAGQLHRLAIAWAIFESSVRSGPGLILADEFASVLDPATANILCMQIRKLSAASGMAIILATPRPELLEYLQPDCIIVKPLGGEAKFIPANHPPKKYSGSADKIPPVKFDPCRWPVARGNIRDYRRLAGFHYLAGPPALHKRVYVIRVPKTFRRWGLPEIAAVLVVSPPVSCCRGRNLATQNRFFPAGLPRRRKNILAALNANIECISRVIVHPVFRSAGLAVRLIGHAIKTAQTPLIETLASMGRIHPMFIRAGMTAIGLCKGTSRFYSYFLAHRPAGPVVLEWLAKKEAGKTPEVPGKGNPLARSQI